jgi:hypothetical protein
MAERGNVAICKGKNRGTSSWYLILIIVKSVVALNKEEGTHCCISMATLNIVYC